MQNSNFKYSRQREAIRRMIRDRVDHPTAETLYSEVKAEIPNISMATVYRNLNQMSEQGEIMTVNTDGASRFDPNPIPHPHFVCRSCGAVLDVPVDSDIMNDIRKSFGGKIESAEVLFRGLCEDCIAKNNQV